MNMLGIEWLAVEKFTSELKHWERNPRRISPENYNRLKDSLLKEGMHQVLTIDTDGTVLSGNQRLDILTELEIEKVWCLMPRRPISEEERVRISLESNIHHGSWDYDLLSVYDTQMLLDVGFTNVQLGIESIEKTKETDTRQVIECPHCSGGIKLSNRVKKVEKVVSDK
jgi:hypothetical protein